MSPRLLVRNSSVSTSTSSVQVLAANPRRISFTLVNVTSGKQTVALSVTPAVANAGIRLSENGVAQMQAARPGDYIYTGPVQVIDTLSGTCAVTEITLED